jgi:hypothetical protein
MADTILRLIPEDPEVVPSATAREKATQVLRRTMPAEDVSNLVTPHVRFVDCGGNFEGVACPRCGANVGEWWTLAMEASHEAQFCDLRVTLPCCAQRTTLNDLVYSWPAGLARFTLEVLNPGLSSVPEPVRQRLEATLGCRLRLIWADY